MVRPDDDENKASQTWILMTSGGSLIEMPILLQRFLNAEDRWMSSSISSSSNQLTLLLYTTTDDHKVKRIVKLHVTDKGQLSDIHEIKIANKQSNSLHVSQPDNKDLLSNNKPR